MIRIRHNTKNNTNTTQIYEYVKNNFLYIQTSKNLYNILNIKKNDIKKHKHDMTRIHKLSYLTFLFIPYKFLKNIMVIK